MSTKYKNSKDIPTEVLCKRLEALSDAVTKGHAGRGEFTMSMPAQLDRDADLVLSEAANRLRRLSSVVELQGDGVVRNEILGFISSLSNSDPYIETIYKNGGCYQFHLILKRLWPNAIAVTNEKFTDNTKSASLSSCAGILIVNSPRPA